MISFSAINDRILEIRDGDKPPEYWVQLGSYLGRMIPSLEEAFNTEDSVVLVFKTEHDMKYDDPGQLVRHFDDYQDKGDDSTGNKIQIPVNYTEQGTDLELLGRRLGLTPAEIVDWHTGSEYRLVMYGFVPGFAYLSGLPDRLRIPRKETPSLRVKAGSVSIAEGYTGIYPYDMQGGWYILGFTDFRFVDDSLSMVRCKPGDRIEFVSI